MTQGQTISYVVPAHNEATTLPVIVRRLHDRLAREHPGSEVIIVENGSVDDTLAVAEALVIEYSKGDSPVSVLCEHSEPGLGSAMRLGVATSRASVVAMTGGLAFGFSDLDQWTSMRQGVAFMIGSKAHPASELHRTWARSMTTAGFKALRALLLPTTVGDSQGSFFIDGDLARVLFPLTVEPGYVCQAEVVTLAELAGIEIVEVPIVLNDPNAPSSIRLLQTPVEMLRGLLRIRKRIPQMREQLGSADHGPAQTPWDT